MVLPCFDKIYQNTQILLFIIIVKIWNINLLGNGFAMFCKICKNIKIYIPMIIDNIDFPWFV